jgi:hypothetical protein
MYIHDKDDVNVSRENFGTLDGETLSVHCIPSFVSMVPHMRISWWAKSIAMHFAVVQMPTS